MKKINYESMIKQALDWGYKNALEPGVPKLDSANDLAISYLKKDGTLEQKVKALIRWQNAKAGTSGFLSSLGGLITLPVTLPANITSVLYIQIRMISAIAIMGGHDIKDERVKTMVFACLCGKAATEILKEAGISVSTKLTKQLIKSISFEVIMEINKAIGFRLVSKFGEKGFASFGKAIPLLGGAFGGSLDALSTNSVGKIARKMFTEE